MRPVILTILFWLLAIWFEPTLSSLFSWFKPNLMFLFSVIICFRWRGNETLFISMVFGLTADSFSSLPFGTMGLTFFLFSLFLRWYAVKIFQNSMISLPIIVGILTLTINIFILLILLFIFDEQHFSVGWLKNLILFEVVPTAVLAVPCFKLFTTIETKLRIRLAERKY